MKLFTRSNGTGTQRARTLFSVLVILLLCALLATVFVACRKGDPIEVASVSEEFIREYYVGEAFKEGGMLEVRRGRDTIFRLAITADMVEGFDTSAPGDYTLHVTAGGYSAETVIRVKTMTAQSITLDEETLPSIIFYGDVFPSDVTLTAVLADGTVREKVPVTSRMLDFFDSTRVGEQEITVSYLGKQASFTVTVMRDGPLSFTLQDAKTVYECNEPLFTDGVMLNVLYASEKVVQVPLSSDQVAVDGFSTALGGEGEALVRYGTMTCPYPYSVRKRGVSFVYDESMLPTVIEKGTAFPAEIPATITYNDGTSREFYLTAEENAPGYAEAVLVAGEKEIVIVCEDTEATEVYRFTVLRDITEMRAVTQTEALPQNGAFDGHGWLAVTYEGGETEDIPFDDPRVTVDFSSATIGESVPQTVTFRGHTAVFTVTVYDPNDPQVDHIEVSEGVFRYYVVGEHSIEPDLTGVEVRIVYKYGEPAVVALSRDWVRYDIPELEENEDFAVGRVIVEIGGVSITREITVISEDYAQTVTALNAYGLCAVYAVGDLFDEEKGYLVAELGGGFDSREIRLSDEGVTILGFDTSSAAEERTLTLSYGGQEAAASYRVISDAEKNVVTSVEPVGFNLLLFAGDVLPEDLAPAQLLLVKGYGYQTERVPLERAWLSDEPLTEGFSEVILTYPDLPEQTFTVWVYPAAAKEEVTSIRVEDTVVTHIGVAPDYALYHLVVTYGYGYATEEIPLNAEGVTITGLDLTQTTGQIQWVTVEYAGKSCLTAVSFDQTNLLSGVTIWSESKTLFEPSEEINGVYLVLSYADGSRLAEVTAAMAPAFDTTSGGTHTITIRYSNYNVSFTYRVEGEFPEPEEGEGSEGED